MTGGVLQLRRSRLQFDNVHFRGDNPGVYPDRHGQPVSNTFDFYGPDGTPHAR